MHAHAVTDATRLRNATRRVDEAVRDRADLNELMDTCSTELMRLAPWDALFLSAADPHTGQFTATRCVRELPPEMCAPWMHNEFLANDVNKFAHLRSRGDVLNAVSTVHEATQGQPALSARYREIYRPYDLGHELRAVLSDTTGTWGYLTMVREHGSDDFTARERSLIGRFGPVVASAIRASHRAVAPTSPRTAPPGVMNIGREGDVLDASDTAVALVDSICMASVLAVAASTFAQADGRPAPEPLTRVRVSEDSWMLIRGDVVRVDGETHAASVIIEPARAVDLLPVMIAAHGLTRREVEVLKELAHGLTTEQIATRLELSRHTVRDHVKELFTKVGVSSRGELIHHLFGTAL